MRWLIALVMVSSGSPRPAPDSIRIARLAAVGRLWGVVKYFHPAVADGNGSWDANTAIAIDEIRAADGRAEYTAAVGRLLATLHDPVTRLAPPAAPTANATRRASLAWRSNGADSTLLVTVPAFGEQTMTLLRQAPPFMRKAARIVFDLRGLTPGETDYATSLFARSGTDSLLPASAMAVPATRMRMHSGYSNVSATTSGQYWSGTYDRRGATFSAASDGKRRPIVFLVNTNSDIPDIAFALQSNGQGSFVVDGDSPILEAAASTYTVSLGEGVEASVRIGDLVGAVADTVIAHGSTGDAPLSVALGVGPRGSWTAASPPWPTSQASASALRDAPCPSTAYRVLAAIQWWNAIHYFYPYKALIGEDWDAVLPKSIAQMEVAADSMAYALSVASMATHIHDSHGFTIGPTMEGYYGTGYVAAHLQYINGEPVVASIAPDSATRASGLAVGDVILRVDGETAVAKRARLAQYIPHSTPQSLDALVARGILTGSPGMARVTVRDARERTRELLVPRTAAMLQYLESPRFGPVLRILPGNIGYADLSRLTVSMVDSMFQMFSHTTAIIFDDRGYPQYTAWSIAPRLTDKANVPVALFDRPLVMSPDSTSWATYSFVQTLPATTMPRYHGRTVMLIDERSLSQAEHTGLFFEAANHTMFVGSPTMGANGDVTAVDLPGGLSVYFTGQSVRHADGRQLQRVGLTPDIRVRPTLAGIRAGRDEVLERALRYLRAPTSPRRQ